MVNVARLVVQFGIIAVTALLVLDEYEIIELRVPSRQQLNFRYFSGNDIVVCDDDDADIDRPRPGAAGLYPQEELLLRLAEEQKYYGKWRRVHNVSAYARPRLSDLPGDHTPSVIGCAESAVVSSTFERRNATAFVLGTYTAGDCIDACLNSTFRYAALDRDGCLCKSQLPADLTIWPSGLQAESPAVLGLASLESLCDAPARTAVFGTGLHKMLIGRDGMLMDLSTFLDFQFGHRPSYRTYLHCGTQNVSSWEHRDMNVLIPVRGRERNLKTTILYLLDSAEQVSATFRIRVIVIELGNPCRFKLLAAELGIDWYCIPFQTYRMYGTLGVFSRAFGFNFGFTVAYPARWTLYHDADMPVEKTFFSKVVYSYLSNRKMAALQTYANMHVEYFGLKKSEHIRSLALAGNRTLVDLVDLAGGYSSGRPMYGGSTLIRRDIFLKIGGFYAEIYWGWAGEDRNFWKRLSEVTTIKLGDEPPLLGMHLHHDQSEVDDYPKGEPDMVAYEEYGKFCGSLSRTNVSVKGWAKIRQLKQQLLSPTLRKLNISA
eukprot:TRINITY_DN32610_c0_g1_i1.p1 TRINITY_DN32610_c0_g1~~TRINITY_DN32610_c0_g1_i1.p1  ORF type:complete len:545 (+),score=56.81 TRINITY_DN32610_c0_g1_i1:77-1711(+)